jgi:DeoR/GlpR family transcriptional regulator of sugar metabolism
VGNTLLKIDRQELIKQILKKDGSILISDISQQLDCSSETIRRDLLELEKQGFAKKIYGGAYIPNEYDKSVPVSLRNTFFNEEKTQMAHCVLDFIKDGDTIFLDASSTCRRIAEVLIQVRRHITIITNSIDIINSYHMDADEHLICLGGFWNANNRAFQGIQTLSDVNNYTANKAFISCPSVELEFGLTDNSQEAAAIRRSMLEHSRENFLVVDHTKFNSHSDFVISDVSKIDTIVTDCKVSDEWDIFCKNNEINVCYEPRN